jgi:hypothetical protein
VIPRHRVAAATTLFVVVAVAGLLAAAPHRPSATAINLGLLVLAFLVPALRVGTWGDIRDTWRWLLPWLVGLTVVWDGLTALAGQRPFLSEWWLVYSTGPLTLYFLLGLHVSLCALFRRVWSREQTAGNGTR